MRADVVFLDMDVVCFDTVYDMFAGPNGSPLPYDYGVCITDDASMPINIGVMTVPARSYMAACQFLEEVLALYDFDLTFTAGQVAIAQMLEVRPTCCVVLLLSVVAYGGTVHRQPPRGFRWLSTHVLHRSRCCCYCSCCCYYCCYFHHCCFGAAGAP